ncbi:MAG: 3-dehydroquinate synthase [Bacteroidota bacterium]
MEDTKRIDSGTHEVIISQGLPTALRDVFIQEESPSGPYLVLVDEQTHKHCFRQLFELQGVWYHPLVIGVGEASKKLETVERVCQMMLDQKANRQTLLVNLGGGVVSDIGGMVASVFMRGIRYINIPTSLLAMTDAAIGGKTGVDLHGYKNILGTFHPPKQTIVYPGFLRSLPEKQWREGLVETWKHALIGDVALWQQLISDASEFTYEQRASRRAMDWIAQSIAVKANIVKQDPLEKDVRKHLNFGHTVAHAVEAWAYKHSTKHITHGQAVAIGLVCESYVSQKLLGLDIPIVESLKSLCKYHFPDLRIHPESFAFLLSAMRKDKKSDGNGITCVLLERLGSPKVCADLSEELFLESFNFFNGF